MSIQIEDQTKKFSQAELDELRNFITNELLSTEEELEWLSKIIIRDDIRASYSGYWKAKFHVNPENPDEIDGIAAVIILNHFHLRTLKRLKSTLAHEYGHHWTLTYLAVSQGMDYMRHRMPVEYYQLRGLDEHNYAHDYSKGWYYCDKEVIAEDYRVLFAPSPHNQEHRIAINSGSQLASPSEEIREYIRKLAEYELD